MNQLRQQNSPTPTFRKYLNFLTALLLLTFFSFPSYLFAACSTTYKGFATINEVDQTGAANRFVELKILNPSVVGTSYKQWTINICNDADECTGDISYFTADDSNNPWIVAKHPLVPYRATPSSKPYIDMDNGFDIILKDASGLTIDYFSVEGYLNQQDSTCPPVFDWNWDRAGAGLNQNYNTDNLRRTPDGNGDWNSPGSGNSGGDSESTTNDTLPGGGTPPTISINNVSVIKGQPAIFTFSLGAGAVGYDVSIDYQTIDATAIAGTDYTTTSGTALISAGNTSTTVNVLTNTSSTSGQVYFYLYLSNPVNSTVTYNYITGTILANPLAEWTMDQGGWSGATNEVIDSSGNNNHGTAVNGTSAANVTPAKPGSPGTCGYSSFDGNNDYIALPGFPNLTGSFTIAGWIKPNAIDNDQRIFVDDENNSGGYAFSLGDGGDGQLRFFSRDISPVSLDSNAAITSGTWYHVAAVHDSINKTRQLFVNGVAVTTAQTYTGSWGTDTGTASIGGETKDAGSENNSNWRFDGLIDEMRVYTNALNSSALITLMNFTRPCTSLHHIEFIHDGSALTCNPEGLTIKACADNAVPCAPYTSEVTVGLLPTGWVGGDSVTFTSVTGSADYNLKHTVAETVTLSTSSVSPTASNALVCKTAAGAVINPCNIVFSDSGFIFSNDTDTNTILPTQLSGKNSNVGFNAKTITLQAVKKSDSDPAQCAPAFQNKTLNVDFAAECKNPTSCIADKKLTLNGSALTATTNDNAAAGSSSYDTRSVTFDANGKYSIIFNYPEAGAIELHARHNILLADGTTPSGNYMSGESSFVVRPFGLFLDVSGQRAADYVDNGTLDNSTGTNLSYAADASGSVFKKAGESFIASLTAVQWQAADDLDNDGIADSGANLSNNTTTTNFGNESTAVTPANVTASHTTTLPNAGSLTNSANSAGFTNGVGTKTLAWSEVGIMDLTATLSNYLSGGQNIVTTAPSFGRFTPDHFDTIITHGCIGGSTFTYSGQAFTATVFARNTANATTLNYRDGYAKVVTLSDANPATPALGAFSTNTITTTSFTSTTAENGSSTGVGAQPNLLYTFTNKETAPETIEIRASDTDSISSNGFTEGSTEIRSGRSRLENAYGSELVDMAVPAQVEFYNTNGFEINTADTCSTISVGLTDIGGAADPIVVGDGSAVGQTCVWDDDAESGANNCSGATPGPVASQFEEPPVTGIFNLNLKAPGADKTGDIGLTLTSPSWLQYDWDGNGTHDNNPTGSASFGLYRGDDRVIYWREVFQ